MAHVRITYLDTAICYEAAAMRLSSTKAARPDRLLSLALGTSHTTPYIAPATHKADHTAADHDIHHTLTRPAATVYHSNSE